MENFGEGKMFFLASQQDKGKTAESNSGRGGKETNKTGAFSSYRSEDIENGAWGPRAIYS